MGAMAGFGTKGLQTGRRKDARLRLQLDARLDTVVSSQSVRLNDISRTGASVTSDLPLKRGADVFLHWRDIHAFGRVVRLDGNTCGVQFDEPLSDEEVLQARSLSDNMVVIEKVELSAAARDFANGRLSFGSGD